MVQKGQHFEISATRGEGLVRRRVHSQFMIFKFFEKNLKIFPVQLLQNMIDLNVDFIVLMIQLVSYVLINLVFVDLCYFSFSIFSSSLKEQKQSLSKRL